MKVKTSITLSEEVVEQLDVIAKSGESRSEVIEKMLRDGLAERARRERDLRGLERINDNAEEPNRTICLGLPGPRTRTLSPNGATYRISVSSS